MTSDIQSILFKKSNWSLSKSRKWLKKHGFKTHFRNKSPKDETEEYYRFRQKEPYLYKSFRTKKLKDDIVFIFGFRYKKN